MKKLVTNPAFAVILSLVIIFTSSFLSTNVKVNKWLASAASESTEAYAKTVERLRSDASRFPGSVAMRYANIP